MQMPRNGTPRSHHLMRDSVEAGAPQRLHAAAEAADAGQHDAGGVADQTGVGREPSVGADVLQGLLGRAQVADLVVEDRDERHGEAGGDPASPVAGRHERRQERSDARSAQHLR